MQINNPEQSVQDRLVELTRRARHFRIAMLGCGVLVVVFIGLGGLFYGRAASTQPDMAITSVHVPAAVITADAAYVASDLARQGKEAKVMADAKDPERSRKPSNNVNDIGVLVFRTLIKGPLGFIAVLGLFVMGAFTVMRGNLSGVLPIIAAGGFLLMANIMEKAFDIPETVSAGKAPEAKLVVNAPPALQSLIDQKAWKDAADRLPHVATTEQSDYILAQADIIASKSSQTQSDRVDRVVQAAEVGKLDASPAVLYALERTVKGTVTGRMATAYADRLSVAKQDLQVQSERCWDYAAVIGFCGVVLAGIYYIFRQRVSRISEILKTA